MNRFIALKLRSLMFDRFSLQSFKACKKVYRFIASNLRALIKFVALIDQFSRKTNNCIAFLADKFVMIAAHHYWTVRQPSQFGSQSGLAAWPEWQPSNLVAWAVWRPGQCGCLSTVAT
jgi:hypothetical protein